VAWTTALLRPDVFPAVAALSVPYRGRGPGEPLAMLRKSGYEDYYWIYFQEPGVAEAEFEQDVPATMRKILVGLSGEAPEGSVSIGRVPAGGGFLTNRSVPEVLPAWLSEQDLAVFVAAFQRTGFRGGLNWYRNLSLNWELQAPWQGARIQQPAMFIAGTKDGVLAGKRGIAALENMKVAVPHVDIHLVEGAGHWIQQERAAEVSERLVAFARAHT
jgi:pimeloyl-ACP methyl ester carboxylesterase